jgi:hypothetical protein
MAWLLEQLLSSKDAWQTYPIVLLLAIACGGIAGYFLSRLRHQSVIDAQKERIAHKDDVIKLKDSAIAAESHAPTPVLSAASPSTTDPRFREINDKVQQGIESKLRQAITNRRFKFVFNPLSDGSKILSFLPTGEIGEGRNNNESHWRIHNGRIEIINSKGETYSRFFLFPDGKSLHHTNEKDLVSIKGQFMTPLDGVNLSKAVWKVAGGVPGLSMTQREELRMNLGRSGREETIGRETYRTCPLTGRLEEKERGPEGS